MNRADIKKRIEELAGYLMAGASSEALAGSQLWERLVEGAGEGSGGGAGINDFWSYRATASMAATARAIEEGLEYEDQRTLFVVFFAGHAGRDLQAAVLDIKKAALMGRLTRIYRRLGEWFSGTGKRARIQERTASQLEHTARLMAQYQADVKDLAERRSAYWKVKGEVKEAARKAGKPDRGLRIRLAYPA